MKKLFVRITAAAAALIMFVTTVQVCFAANPSGDVLDSQKTTGYSSSNAGANDYLVWSSPVSSYLCSTGAGELIRVEHIGSKIVVETYREGGKRLVGRLDIADELPMFGGFFSGRDFNFMVYGARNPNESDSAEIMRIVKYSKNWQRLGSVSLRGCNTSVPFRAGSLRFAEKGGKLYIHTCHEMYKNSDGYNHQANLTVIVSENNVTVTNVYYSVMDLASAGYVSHSFNQFAEIDSGYLYTVDHGDAYPRGISIVKRNTDDLRKIEYAVPVVFDGNFGENLTGVSVGGFCVSDRVCIMAGNSIDFSNYDTYSEQRNIFICTTDKNLTSHKTVWLTDYSNSDDVYAATPCLVELGSGEFLVMWEESSEYDAVCVKAVVISDSGKMLSPVRDLDARLSDCQPITVGGEVLWYATDSSSPVIYSVNPAELKASASNRPTDPNVVRPPLPSDYDPSDRDEPWQLVSLNENRIAVFDEILTVCALPKTKIRDFFNTVGNEKIHIVAPDDRVLHDEVYMGTGFSVSVCDDGEPISEYIAVVPLDVNGDGKVTSADARMILRSAAKIEPLTELYAAAADIDGSGRVNSADARVALRVAAGLAEICLL